MDTVVYRKPTELDIESVAAFAKQSFRDTFFESAGYNEAEFQDFIELPNAELVKAHCLPFEIHVFFRHNCRSRRSRRAEKLLL